MLICLTLAIDRPRNRLPLFANETKENLSPVRCSPPQLSSAIYAYIWRRRSVLPPWECGAQQPKFRMLSRNGTICGGNGESQIDAPNRYQLCYYYWLYTAGDWYRAECSQPVNSSINFSRGSSSSSGAAASRSSPLQKQNLTVATTKSSCRALYGSSVHTYINCSM